MIDYSIKVENIAGCEDLLMNNDMSYKGVTQP